jgi:hypothetical protein
MFVLYCFVVDFSHLIQAKINLQVAADAAAYAGAAWQARTLNKLSQINYHIRQDLKELAMRVQVVHLRHNRNFPRGQQFISGNPSAPNTEPFICQQAHGYRAISGLRYANDTNLCRNASPSTGGLPPIVVPPVIAAFDPFAVAIAAQIRKIAEAANQECRAAAEDNQALAQHLITVYTRRSQFHAQQMQEISDWLNQVGSGQLNDGEQHPIRKVAYESAIRNLNKTLRNGNLKVEVLQPQGGKYIQLNEHKMRASLFYINFNVVGDGCVGRPAFVDFDDMVAAETKEQPIITYFAVKLSATPELLYMPQAWADAFPQLEAFAAAKPFGGRIGPDSTADQLVPVANRPGNNNRMVNFSFRPGDNLGIMNTKLMAYFDSLMPFNSAGRPDGNQNTGWPDPGQQNADLREALQAIRAPTIFDAILYNISPDPNVEDAYFEPQYASAMYPDYLETYGPDNQRIQVPQSPTSPYFPLNSQNNGQGWIQINASGTAPGGPYGNYASEAPSSHSVVLADKLPGMQGKENEFGFATKAQVHSGWHPNTGQPRIGYSVKFIGFDALERTMIVKLNDQGGRGPIANPPTGDPNLRNIFH